MVLEVSVADRAAVWRGDGEGVGWGNELSKGVSQVGLSTRRKDWAKEIHLLTMDQLRQTQP